MIHLSQLISQYWCTVVQSLSCVSLWTHGLQHARLPWPSRYPTTCSNACPLSRWCHPTVSSSVVPFSFCPQSFLTSGAFPMSWLFAWGGQSIDVLLLTKVYNLFRFPHLSFNVLFLFGDPILSGLCLPDAQKSGYPADREGISGRGGAADSAHFLQDACGPKARGRHSQLLLNRPLISCSRLSQAMKKTGTTPMKPSYVWNLASSLSESRFKQPL